MNIFTTLFIAIFLLLGHITYAKEHLLSGLQYPDLTPFQWNYENAKEASVILFLSTKCPCSNSHIPHLTELQKKFSSFSFFVVHSNFDETPEQGKEYFSKNHFSFPVLRDQKNFMADQLKALKTPHAFIISKSGDILYQGGVSSSSDAKRAETFYLQEALQDLTEKKNIRRPSTRTLGCALPRTHSL
jgi:hypothetical protein